MKYAKQITFVLYLLVMVLALWEYLFVRGMFTAFLAMAAVALMAAVNVVLEGREGQWKSAALYAISAITLVAAYLPWL